MAILRRVSRFFETKTWGSKTRTDLHLTVAVDHTCATDGIQPGFANAVQRRNVRRRFRASKLHDSDCLRCSSREVTLVGPMKPTQSRGILVQVRSCSLARPPRRHRRWTPQNTRPLALTETLKRHLCHQLKTNEHSRIRFLTSKTWRGFTRLGCTEVQWARHVNADDFIRKRCHRPWRSRG